MKTYNSVFHGYESQGIIEEVPENEIKSERPIYYMPHHPVIKEKSISTQVRPVFDVSSPSYNNISLNDCLLTGPSLVPDLFEVLIRFRKWQIALTSDVTKAFLQIEVDPDDRDVHRFLLIEIVDGKKVVRHMRFVRLPFGNRSAPFLLNATVRYHLAHYNATKTVSDLKRNIFVDNYITGADSIEEAHNIHLEAREILNQANMPLTKWHSNNADLCKLFEDPMDPSIANNPISILGMGWSAKNDTFIFEGFNPSECEVVSTKRAVLSCIAKIFDPMGIVSPFTMHARILF